MRMLYSNTNSSSKTPSPYSLIGPKLNGACVRIEGDLDATEWTAFVAATFSGTRLDRASAQVVADTLEDRITRELDLAGHEVVVTTTCPRCFQIHVSTSDPRVVAWIQGQEECNPVGLLIDCIHKHWMNFGCYDGPSHGEPCDDCSPEGTQLEGDSMGVGKVQAKGPTLDV
jgi:hypothetical protein